MAWIQNIIVYFSLFTSLFFEVFMLITYLEVREELKREKRLIRPDQKQFPTVTVIVPCFNEENTVKNTISSLLNLDYPKDRLSLIVIDDGSTDGTRRVLADFEKYPHISVFMKENGGKHTALNFALEKVESELVGCLDADSFVNSDALRRITPFFDDITIMAVTPSVKVFEPKSVLQYIQKIEYSWGIFLRRMLSSIGALYVTPGPFSIFRTRVFRELGGYRYAHHTEDLEMALRMQKHHYRIVNSHGAHVYTVAPVNFPALFRQRVRWTYGFLNNAFDYRELFFNRKYGNVGFFILPIATTSIFSTLLLFGSMLWNSLVKVTDLFIKFGAIGFNWPVTAPTYDWFFLDTDTVSLLTVIALMLTFVILFLAIRLAEGRFRFSRGIVYYLLLYVFIVPIWLFKAVLSTVLRRKVSWR